MALSISIGFGVFLVSTSALAVTQPVNTRAAIGSIDFIEWGTLGVEFTPVPNPGEVLSNGGLTVGIFQPPSQGGFEVAQEGGLSWTGNFGLGDDLLRIGGGGALGGVVLDLRTSVGAVGAQVQPVDYQPAFFVVVTAYDSAVAFVGVAMFVGVSTPDQDDSAIFAGIASSTADIGLVEFHVFDQTGQPTDFALNRVEIGGPYSVVVPEASTWWSGGALGLVLSGWVWRTRRRHG